MNTVSKTIPFQPPRRLLNGATRIPQLFLLKKGNYITGHQMSCHWLGQRENDNRTINSIKHRGHCSHFITNLTWEATGQAYFSLYFIFESIWGQFPVLEDQKKCFWNDRMYCRSRVKRNWAYLKATGSLCHPGQVTLPLWVYFSEDLFIDSSVF